LIGASGPNPCGAQTRIAEQLRCSLPTGGCAAVMARDYRAEAVPAPESLGIADRSAKELSTL